MADYRPGDLAYLYPTLPTAPAAAYRYPPPRVVVVAVAGPRVTVSLPDERQVTTDRANVVRQLPEPAPARKPAARAPMPDGFAEVTLW
jgi:hypothetical protein